MNVFPRLRLGTLLATALLVSCELPDTPAKTPAKPAAAPKPAAPATPAPATPATPARTYVAGSLTGTWLYKTETMVLKQSGSSIQGTTAAPQFKNDPANPIVLPVPTVGSVGAKNVVKLDELINYTRNPSQNYLVRKVGGLTNADTLVLDVVAGQKAHTQTWIRKK